ncbi:2786_t:CDS:2, partial [Racocetra persica]
DIKRKYDTIVDLGCGCGHVVKHIDQDISKKLLMCDMSEKMLERDKNVTYDVEVERIVVDEELLPFKENSLEAVISNLSLHWVNDLPGTMIQIQRSLKPDGLFLASMFGGDTLFELRYTNMHNYSKLEREQGVSPRVSPMTDIRDVGSLLSRAGFALTTIDVDDVIVNYPTMFELIKDLKAMGESNAMNVEESPTSAIIDTEEIDDSFTKKKLPTNNVEHSLIFDSFSINSINSINLSDSTDSVFNYTFFEDHSSEIFFPASLVVQSILTLLELISIFNALVRCKSGIRTIALCAIGFLTYFILAVMNILMIPPDRFCYLKNHMPSCNLFSAILVLTWVPVACYLLIMGLITNEWWERKCVPPRRN